MLHTHSEYKLELRGAHREPARSRDEVATAMDMPSIESAPALAASRLPPTPPPRRFAKLVDRVGATASFLCAVHCALLPFVLALLPLIGLGFLAGHTFERVFVACAAALASASIIIAYRRHRRPQALLLMVPGITLLLCGVTVDIDAHVLLHTIAVVCGGVLVASAHVTNLFLAHRHHSAAHAHVAA